MREFMRKKKLAQAEAKLEELEQRYAERVKVYEAGSDRPVALYEGNGGPSIPPEARLWSHTEIESPRVPKGDYFESQSGEIYQRMINGAIGWYKLTAYEAAVVREAITGYTMTENDADYVRRSLGLPEDAEL